MDEVNQASNRRKGWIGFEGRTFLTDVEHGVYCRRLPVRYSAKFAGPKPMHCAVCGKVGTSENPLQAAHRVPFALGILEFKFTPEWLDSQHNLVWAHRTACNRNAEMSRQQIDEVVARYNSIQLPLDQKPTFNPLR